MEVVLMQRQWIEYTKSLFMEGFLDGQFIELQKLQDEGNPNFIVEVVSLFFEDSERLLNDLTRALNEPDVDFQKVDGHVHQLKGSSSSIGAHRVKNVCISIRSSAEEHYTEGGVAVVEGLDFEGVLPSRCLRYLQQLKQETCLVKNKLENLFRMEQQILAAGGSIPSTEMIF